MGVYVGCAWLEVLMMDTVRHCWVLTWCLLQLLGRSLEPVGMGEAWQVGRKLISSPSSLCASFTLLVMSNRSGASYRRGRSCVACTVRPTGNLEVHDKFLATRVAKV